MALRMLVSDSVDVVTTKSGTSYPEPQTIRTSGWKRNTSLNSTNTYFPVAHRFNRGRDGGMIADLGAPFTAVKRRIEGVDLRPIDLSSPDNPIKYGGLAERCTTVITPSTDFTSLLNHRDLYPDDDLFSTRLIMGSPAGMTSMEMHALGTTAIARCAPTNPAVDLATAIAELIGAKKFFSLPGKSGSMSGEYLNLQLGVIPVISDVKATYEAWRDQDKILSQYERGSGKLTRRRYEFPEVTESTTAVRQGVGAGYLGVQPTGHTTKAGTCTITTKLTTRAWFSGAFTYLAPPKGWCRSLAKTHHLYGVKPGRETAWNVLPLSFVADYFANTGDVLRNLDAFTRDGLVMPYGYVMRTAERRDDYVWTGQIRIGGVWTTRSVHGSIISSHKQRVRANPFGFGLTDGSLSARQISILAALGMSRR